MIIIMAGNWYVFHRSQQMLVEEIQARGNWIARSLAYSLQFEEFIGDEDRMRQLMEKTLRENDVIYLVLIDKNAQMVLAESKYEQQSLPNVIQKSFCERGEPGISDHTLGNEPLYNVGVRIIRQENNRAENARDDQRSQDVCLGTVHIGISLENTRNKLTRLFTIALVITGVVVGIGVIGHLLVSRMLVAPLLRISEIAMKISEGDLQQTVELTSNGEMEILETALARILQSSQTIAGRLQTACEQIKRMSDEMLNISEDQALIAQKQVTSLYQVSQTIEEIAGSSKHIATHADALAEEAESTLKSALNIGGIVQNTISGMKDIRVQVGKNTERVVLLGERISQISNVVKIINTIADHTKLIAFNASIEAAGAGEAGGRFSVVATEVRRLANTVVESVGEIKNSVSSIQVATRELILSSETGIRKVNQSSLLITEIGNTLQQIMDLLEKTANSAREISESMQQQQAGNDGIVERIREISDDSDQSVDISKRANEIAGELRTLAEELDTTAQQFGM